LQKDIQDIVGLEDISIIETDSFSSVIIHFISDEPNLPNNFLITISRYYPHSCPVIRCLNIRFPCEYISVDGIIEHPSLGDNWTAIGSLMTIIDILQSIRSLQTTLFTGSEGELTDTIGSTKSIRLYTTILDSQSEVMSVTDPLQSESESGYYAMTLDNNGEDEGYDSDTLISNYLST
jgi:hypothetical protein